MCDIATAAMLVGTAVQAGGQYQQGKYQKALAYQQASLEEAKGRDAIERGLLEEKKVNREYARIKGTQKNQLAASGLSLSGGSPADVLAGTEAARADDVNVTRINAQRSRWGFLNNAVSMRAEGDAAKKAGTINAIGTVINGVSMVAPKWYKPNTMGAKAMQAQPPQNSNFYQGNGNLTWMQG